ncbi:MAG: C40 family peptidase [Bacteroidales bacterium]|nr:C40 family peptidase [Bacteroidales bacterium]
MLKKVLFVAIISTLSLSCMKTTHKTVYKPSNTTTTTTTRGGGTNTNGGGRKVNIHGKKTDNTNGGNTGSYAQYGQKFNTTFKGNEDLKLLKELASWLGTPYLYGAQTKGKGTDCSGFVMMAIQNTYGIKLNRTAGSMLSNVNFVDRNSLECGDLIFFGTSKNVYHVGLSLGGDRFIHSASSNKVGVKTETLTLNYYKQNYYRAGRIKQLDKRTPQRRDAVLNVVETIAAKPSTTTEFSEQMGVNFEGNEDQKLLTEISEWMDTPFHTGMAEKKVGTDGIGFVTGVYKNVYGINYEHNTEKVMAALKKIDQSDLKFGDIVVYKYEDKYPVIGIYLADGKIAYTSINGVATVEMAIGAYDLYFCGRPIK